MRGFTLFETLVALALLAVLLAVAVPALVPSPAVELRAAADTVATGLRQARLEAQRRQVPTALHIDLDARTLQVEGSGSSRALPQDLVIELVTAEQEMLAVRRGGIRFYPDGSSTGGRVTLSLDGLERRIDVAWLTGRVTVSEDPS
jgi:general secretion pathway protein H